MQQLAVPQQAAGQHFPARCRRHERRCLALCRAGMQCHPGLHPSALCPGHACPGRCWMWCSLARWRRPPAPDLACPDDIQRTVSTGQVRYLQDFDHKPASRSLLGLRNDSCGRTVLDILPHFIPQSMDKEAIIPPPCRHTQQQHRSKTTKLKRYAPCP